MQSYAQMLAGQITLSDEDFRRLGGDDRNSDTPPQHVLVTPLPGARVSPYHPRTERAFGVDASRPLPVGPDDHVRFENVLHVTDEHGLRDVLHHLRAQDLQQYINTLHTIDRALYQAAFGRFLDQVADFYTELVRFSIQIPISGPLARWCYFSARLYRAWLQFHLPTLEEADLGLRTRYRLTWSSLRCLDAHNRWVQWPRPTREERVRLARAYAEMVTGRRLTDDEIRNVLGGDHDRVA